MGESFGNLTPLSETNRLVADPAQDIRGRSVVDSAGEKIGTVADLLVDTDTNHVRILRVEHGGILGFGASSSYIPVEAVMRVTDDEVHVSSSKDHVAGGPPYDPDLADQRDYYEQLHGHYGQQPEYAPGSLFPGASGLTGGIGLPPVR
ncbi:PRC-barrel domain-containing protein [Actinoplanes sp. NEAU-A12]|uniref:PRC-barrel domain-containing protein n=1 Tax=Actinoplanes sandaracinus TaxID=3045177 RepID=A0ABT6WKQ7_9ACTN|nr:PRC-barrel domain-containing protein [Actinoplanes sandaracinus]MDI6100320.1 PRC-barrel domain-containing protein [Actinoplanes sandaracinus]